MEEIFFDLLLTTQVSPSFSIFHFPFSVLLSWLYSLILDKRISLYESGALKSFSLGAFTVGVGNLTVGGTGKTPLVALVAEILAANGETVCVISRGYKRENPKKRVLVSDGEKILADAKQSGDEPFELARKLLGKAVVVSDANRVSAGNWARETFGITAFVLDDAFQHLRAKRDLDIVTVDATNPFGNGKLLPFGILREPLKNLKRADAIVITRANLVESVENLKAEIRKFNSVCPIFVSENKIFDLVEIKEFPAKAQGEANYELRITNYETEKFQIPNSKFQVPNPKTENQIQNPKSRIQNLQSEDPKPETQNLKPGFLAFCGLGNPRNFFEQLRGENFDLISTATFPDHYFYKQKDIEKLEENARQKGAQVLLTTAKDAVKLKNLEFALPCFVVESEIIFAGNDFRNWLIEKLKSSEQK